MKKIFSFLVCLLCFFTAGQSLARIDMTEHILVMQPRERSAELTILNLSNQTRSFNTEIVNYEQTSPNGGYNTLEGPLNPVFDPQEIVRYTPRTFTLGPNGQQKIRISLRKPADLPDGEYRFHFKGTSFATAKESEPTNENVRVHMSVNMAMSIPIVVRHGDVSSTGRLSDFELLPPSRTKSEKPELQFTATREGNAGTLGNIYIDWARDGDNYEQIGFATNFNVFSEINERIGSIPLNTLPTEGTLRVTYRNNLTNDIYDQIIFDL